MARQRGIPLLFRAALPLPLRLARAILPLILLALVAALAAPSALTALGLYLTVDGGPREADAIVVLSGDAGSRLEQGIQLYKQGYAPVLVLAGAGEDGHPSAAEVMSREAMAEGVPGSAIFLVDQSKSTHEDAAFTRDLMAKRGMKSALLVTSTYHGKRAALAFARVFEGSGIQVTPCPVRDERWRPDGWWLAGDTIRLTFNELIKLAYYQLNGYL